QALALDQFHGDVEDAVFFAGVVDDNYIRVREQASRARFGLEAAEQFRARQARAFLAEANRFHGDGAADDRVHRFIDDTHGAAAQFADDFVATRFRSRGHSPFCPWIPRRFAALWQKCTTADTRAPYDGQ